MEARDLAVFQKRIEEQNYAITPEITEIVLRTFADTIKPSPNKGADAVVYYGATPKDNTAPNGAVVFGIGIAAELDADGNYADRSGYTQTIQALAADTMTALEQEWADNAGGITVRFLLER